jgi:UPF0755 protein
VRRSAFVALVLVVVALGAGAFWFRERVVVDRSLPSEATTVIVPDGATGHEIAALLAKDRVINSALGFEWLARFEHAQNAMNAGEFRFPAHLSARDVLHQITAGGAQIATWVTIPEGFTSVQIAQTFAARGFGPEAALQAEFRHGSLNFDGRRTPSLEGYLFPDTYLIASGATPAQIASALTAEFARRLPPDAAARARELGLTLPQIVTLASLVEREGKADEERPLIAGVYYNRLRRGMTLDVDATLEYTFTHHKDVITYADLASDSPYNTYKHLGLPPTPIANPGLPSLLAALHPQASDYLYYVAMGNGHHAFSRTLAEHNANVARYLR